MEQSQISRCLDMQVNGNHLHVEIQGPETGSVVVLLHHGLGSVRAWREQIPQLVNAGYHVIAYDRWGSGGSDRRPSLNIPTFRTDITDLLSLLEQLGIRRVALVGHSDGGTLALYFAAMYPAIVSCLVTVAAHIYVEPKMESAILGIEHDFQTNAHFRMALRSVHGEKVESVFHNWFDGWNRLDNRSWDMRPLLHQIQCPCLIVQGEADEHATPQHARDLAEAIPQAELWLVPEAGHMLPQEQSGLFNPGLLQFLHKHVAAEK